MTAARIEARRELLLEALASRGVGTTHDVVAAAYVAGERFPYRFYNQAYGDLRQLARDGRVVWVASNGLSPAYWSLTEAEKDLRVRAAKVSAFLEEQFALPPAENR